MYITLFDVFMIMHNHRVMSVRRMPVFFGQLKFRFILVLAVVNGAEHPLSVF